MQKTTTNPTPAPAVPSIPQHTINTDKYTANTRQDLIQQPIEDQLLLREQDLICRLDIRLDVNRKNCPFRESTRIEYDKATATITSARKTQSRQSPPPSAFIAAYRELHSYLFKILDEMIFKIPANEIPHHQRTLAYSFAEDSSASDRSVRPLHYHCLIFSNEPRVRTTLQDPFFRLKLISKVQIYLNQHFHRSKNSSRLVRSPIKQSLFYTFKFRMPDPSIDENDNDHRRDIITYATKCVFRTIVNTHFVSS